jgi:very-short-patch-repair endonuclease
VVSHGSAAWVWGLLPDPPAVVDVTVRRGVRNPQNRAGLQIHRSTDLDVAAAVERRAILVTNPLRTLVDTAGFLRPSQLTDAVDNALARRLLTVEGLVAELERLSRPGRTGVGTLRDHLRERAFIGAPSPSVLEAHMWRLIRLTGLPWPTLECVVFGGLYRLDTAWKEIHFSVEVDGYAWHFSPEHMARDTARRNRLLQAGWTVLAYTWRDVVNEPQRVATEITATYQRLSRPG